MLVENSFDLWKKDGFFSAAEQVQESADTMEFAFRTWLRELREGLNPSDLDDLRRELQTTLGIAKWQLEEFEKAVRDSYGSRGEKLVMERHKQFVSVIGNQISRVDIALRESYEKEGKQPLCWVNLNEEECDDLASFLSGSPPAPCNVEAECSSLVKSYRHENYGKKPAAINITSPSMLSSSFKIEGSQNAYAVDKNSQHVVELEMQESSRRVDDTVTKMDRITKARRTNSPIVPDLKIVIADETKERKHPVTSLEVTGKGKAGPILWMRGCGDFSQLFGRSQFQRQVYSPWHMQLACSVRFILALMLTIFLIVPIVFYSA